MDLLLIARKIWRYKLVSLPVILLTAWGAAYVVVVKEPLYEAKSSFLLINPPPPPTEQEVARNPALGRVRADNPYTRFADQAVVIDVLARTMNSDSARPALVRAGADPRYMVASGAQFGSSSPIVQITGTGSTPQSAMRTASVVGHGVVGELDRMQRVHQVDTAYRIKMFQVEAPDGAQLRASGQLRMLVGVLGFGTIVLFVVISVADALGTLLSERRAAQVQRAWSPDELFFLEPDPDLDSAVRTNGHAEELPSSQTSTPPNSERPA